jgi:hypothetical protein
MHCARCGASTSPPKSPDLRRLGMMRGVVSGIDPAATIAQLQRIICRARYHTDLRRNASRLPPERADGGHSAHCRNSSSRYRGVPAVTTLGRAGIPGNSRDEERPIRMLSRPRLVSAAFPGAELRRTPHVGWHGARFEQGGHRRGNPRAAGNRTRGRAGLSSRSAWNMLARDGIIRGTGCTAAPFTCPRGAAHARA